MKMRVSPAAWRDIEKVYFDALEFAKQGILRSPGEFYEYLSEQWISEPAHQNPLREPMIVEMDDAVAPFDHRILSEDALYAMEAKS